jgi:tetratricopeptide (TPR) repeat protein
MSSTRSAKRLKKGGHAAGSASLKKKADTQVGSAPSATHPYSLRQVLWFAAALIAITVAVYAPVRHFDFVPIDDPSFVSENPRAAGGLTWSAVVWAFSTGHTGNWHPLTWLSHMLDVEVFGISAPGHHIVSLALHLANTLLLFWVLVTMTRAPGRSAWVAALFAVHPLHVESVAWVAERKDVLSTLFFLLTLWAYAAYVRRPATGRYLRMLICFALGLMAKPMLVTLPLLLLLLDVWPLRRVTTEAGARNRPGNGLPRNWFSALARLVPEKIPLFALSAVSSVVTFLVQQRAGAVSTLDQIPFTLRAANALVSYVVYLGKMIWPVHLTVLYPFPQDIPALWIAGAALTLICISVAVFRSAGQRPYLLVGWFWYLGTLFPVIGLIQVGIQSMADRYTYIPLVGIFILIAWGVPDLLAGRSGRRVLPVAAGVVVLLCAIAARAQVRFWANGIALWEHAVELTLGMDNYSAHMGLGQVLRQQGRLDEAVAHFTEAVRIKPASPEARRNLWLALSDQGKLDEAVASLSEAVRLNPGKADDHVELGLALSRLGKSEEAIPHFLEALRLNPDSAEVHNSLGIALSGGGKTAEGIQHFREAIRLKPDFAEAHFNLGLSLRSQGQAAEAFAQFSEAVRLRPDNAEAQNALGWALAAQGKVGDAITHYREALQLSPEYAEAHSNLALALASQGHNEEALSQFSETMRLRPNSAVARLNYGKALADAGRHGEAILQFKEVLRIDPKNRTARSALEYLARQSRE